jgi:hypothetical protein
MYKVKRLKSRLMLLVSDRFLAPTPIDAEIKAINKSLLVTKTSQTPSLFKMIKQRNKENNRLRHKLTH